MPPQNSMVCLLPRDVLEVCHAAFRDPESGNVQAWCHPADGGTESLNGDLALNRWRGIETIWFMQSFALNAPMPHC